MTVISTALQKKLESWVDYSGKAQLYAMPKTSPEFEKWNEKKLGFFAIEKIINHAGLVQIYSKPSLTFFFNIAELKRRGIFALKEVTINDRKGFRAVDGSVIFFKTTDFSELERRWFKRG